ncbi:methyl-accepting chemotaxis protein [Rheinheimera sp.]|uniref:methyl-accepting chemotaxis protein n=1 Tax=Rheinheimera sp. TaxID=1869214 RepID=UPI003AF5D551
MGNWSIRQKLLVSLSGAVLVATLLISLISQVMTERVLTERSLQKDLPASLNQIKHNIEAEIRSLEQIAEQLATSVVLHQLTANGREPAAEAQLVAELEQVRQVHGLQAASFCDRQSADYWNERGFLRRLTPEQDGWFFAFKDSGKARQVSVYNSPEVGYQIFVNFQQTDGRGLSGIAKPLTDMVKMISQYKIEQTGFVFLANQQGQIQLHPTQSIGTELSSQFAAGVAAQLLKPGQVNLLTTELNGEATVLASTYIEALDWYLIAQVPQQEISAVMQQIKLTSYFTAAVVTALIGFLSLFISQSISAPIRRLGQLFQQLGQGEADLSVRLDQNGGRELQELTQGFNQFVSNINQLVTDIQHSSRELAGESKELNNAAGHSLQHNQQQLDASAKVEAAIGQMAATVAEIAQNASLSADSTSKASQSVVAGQQQVGLSLQGIKQLAGHVETAQQVIRQLADKAGSIGQILDVIQGIAEQTNLLALNAAIEAARAGEHGRGFAVVADEVRQLAARTQGSTKEIQQVITDLLSQTEQAVQATASASQQALDNVSRSDAVETSLQQITSQIQQLEGMSIQIAAATEQQAMVVQDVGQQVQTMHQISESNLQNAGELQQLAARLGDLSSTLTQLTGRFSA